MKNKVKKIPKKIILAFIICAITFSMVGATASTLLYSGDVIYDNSSSGMGATTVQAALDELYEQAKNVPSCDSEGNCTVTCPSGLSYVITSTGYQCRKLTTAEKLIKNVVTSDSGLYADSVESGRYIYRGPSPDNYITFNGENAGWRIISVESDGTIKIMKISSLGNYVWDTASSRSATYCTHPSYGCNSWGSSSTMLNSSGANVTSMPREYGRTAYALPTSESTLNTYLNGTYYNSLTNKAQSQIVSHNFNVGVLLGGAGQTTATDVSQESAYKWKGKIALANASDYVRASTNANCTGVKAMYETSYCYSNSSSYNWMFNKAYWWTLSPFAHTNYSYYGWTVTSDGSIKTFEVRGDYGVRPVAFLSSAITLSGSGTQSNPYTIN